MGCIALVRCVLVLRFGLVGVVWCGVVWYGVVWCGIRMQAEACIQVTKITTNNIAATTLNQTLPITINCSAVGCGFEAEWSKNELGHYK